TIGKLDNGLTYYLKKNTKFEYKAELRLVINAGSILEDEDQLGLAHFVEHMAFNGTKSFEKNDLIDYLQSIGVEFGADLNAHTGFDETVYKLSVPTDDAKIFDTSLQVLRDWADGITFDDAEIDNERGIVAEELRARSGANMRMYYQSIPVLTNNSRYAKRSPIGTLDVIENSTYDALKRFYRDWYRPKLMALVLVGDFDVVETEKKIKKLFSDLTTVKNPKERIRYSIPENKAPAVSIVTDAEASGVRASIYYKKQETVVRTLEDYKQSLLQKLYTGMLRQRLSEVVLLPNAPFLSARAGIGAFLGDKDSYYLRVALKEDKISEGINTLLEESERAKRYGFTKSELERYKALLLNNADIYRKETGKLSSRYYLEQYIDNFTDHKPIPGDEFKYKFYKNILPGITIDEVNRIGEQWVKNENIAVVLNAPNKESLVLPSENELVEMLNNVTTKEIDRYNDTLGNIKLMDFKPEQGEIIETSYNDKIDVTTWKLSNGVTVMVKPTQLQNDLISMSGFRPGGSSVVPDSLYVSARNAGNIIGSSGINNISTIDLKKLNMGKTVSVT
ncbi:Probable zinc protease pqqL, partial [hydrothermal vent metagenome]